LGGKLIAKVVPFALLGPLLEYVTVPVTACPALTLAGNFSVVTTLAWARPPTVPGLYVADRDRTDAGRGR
jgi:hypothetical protein